MYHTFATKLESSSSVLSYYNRGGGMSQVTHI